MVSLRKTIRWNLRYIEAVNSGDRRPFLLLLEELLNLENAFTKKCYIWNIIRGREFYKNLSFYVVSKAKEVLNGDSDNPEETMARIEQIIQIVMETEKRKTVKQSFVWNITKQVPLITVDTLRYMDAKRVTNILQSEKRVLNDSAMDPFIREIIRLKILVHQTDSTLDDTLNIILDNKT